MKVKILLAPLMIVTIMFLLIWLVYPAYTDGIGGLKEKYALFKQEEAKLNGIFQKVRNMEELSSKLESSENVSKKETLFRFIPEEIKEEEVVDNLNFLAGEQKLSVYNISINQPKKEVAPDPGVITSGDAMSGVTTPGATPDLSGAPQIVVPPKPKATDFTVDFSVAGNYEALKNIFEKINKLERFNKIVSLEIKRPESSGTETDKSPKDSLLAVAVLNFNFFKKSKDPAISDETVFSSNMFNMKPVDDIISSKTTDVLKLPDNNAAERTNPFIP